MNKGKQPGNIGETPTEFVERSPSAKEVPKKFKRSSGDTILNSPHSRK
jgi:hypothetical protein